MSDHIFCKFLRKNLIWQNTGRAGTKEKLTVGADAANAGHLPWCLLKKPQEKITREYGIQCPEPKNLQHKGHCSVLTQAFIVAINELFIPFIC